MGVKKKRFFLKLCMLGKFSKILLPPADFFLKQTFSKNYFRNTIRVSNCLDPDQARRYAWPYLGLNCLQSKLADEDINQQ